MSLITDAYSRKIVGHSIYHTLEATGCLEALDMALKGRSGRNRFMLIHHSDRGIQYCCAAYLELLMSNDVAISMTQSGSPYENALAERVNGTIKNEFFPKIIYQNYHQAKRSIEKIIKTYNEKRPHLGINYLAPEQAHNMEGELPKCWKNYSKSTSQRTMVQKTDQSNVREIQDYQENPAQLN